MNVLYNASVIISTYSISRSPYVLKCIDSIKKQSVSPYEILLVLDPDQKLIEHYSSIVKNDVKILVSDDFGLSHARNKGIKNAKGKIVCFIDDDAYADIDWLKMILLNYRNSDVVGVGGFIKPLWEIHPPTWFPEELFWTVGCSYKGLPNKRSPIRNPIGANMSFRKNVFPEIGYFNPIYGRVGKFPIGDEETEISIRLANKLKSKKIIYEPNAMVFHRVPQSRLNIKYMLKRSFYEGIGKAMIYNKNKLPALSYEKDYLINIITKSIPYRFRFFYKKGNLSQIFILLLSSIATIFGFAKGRARWASSGKVVKEQ